MHTNGGVQSPTSHNTTTRLITKAVQSAALSLERVDHVQSSDRLAAGMLRVGHGVTDDVLKEHLEHTAGLPVDEASHRLGEPDGG